MLTTHRHDRRGRRQDELCLESLDDRLLLSGGASAEAVLHDHPASQVDSYHDISPREGLRHGSPTALPANFSAPLRLLYREYEDQRGNRSLAIRSSRVTVRIKVAFPPALAAYVDALRRDGLHVIRTEPADGVVEGTLPVRRLPAVAKLAAHVWLVRPVEGQAMRLERKVSILSRCSWNIRPGRDRAEIDPQIGSRGNPSLFRDLVRTRHPAGSRDEESGGCPRPLSERSRSRAIQVLAYGATSTCIGPSSRP